MSQKFFTIFKKALMNGIRTSRLDKFAVSVKKVVIIKTIKIDNFIIFIFYLQLNRHLNLVNRRQLLSSLRTVPKRWTNLCEKPPTGFEPYFYIDKKGEDDKKSGGSAKKPFGSAFKQRMNRMSQG